MKTLARKTEVLIAAFSISLLLSAQSPSSSFKGNLTKSKVSDLNSSTISTMKSKTEKSNKIMGNSQSKIKEDKTLENSLEYELNNITHQISETVKFRLESITKAENVNDNEAVLNKMTEEIGKGIKYQPITSL
jgi:hypothetical protein